MSDTKKLINIRITEKEKQQMESIAQKCGLSLSEYLRKRGLGYEPKPLLDDTAFSLYSKLCKLSNLPLSSELELPWQLFCTIYNKRYFSLGSKVRTKSSGR